MNSYSLVIADDSKVFHKTIGAALESTAFKIIGNAYDGEQAVDLYNKLKPDLILLDVIMPKLRGPEALLKILGSDSEAKAVMISIMGAEQLAERAIVGGAKGYLQKPINKKTLEESLIKVLEAESASI